MELPIEQLLIGAFALFTAAVTGAFSIYNTKVSRKIDKTEKKCYTNNKLAAGNELLSEIVPALERKDEALDKIADILDNILNSQDLTAQQLESMNLILRNRCQAMDLLQRILYNQEVKNNAATKDDVKEAIEEIATELYGDGREVKD